MANKKTFETQTVTMASGTKLSTAFNVPEWAVFCGVFVPEIADGDLSVHISTDGTNYYPLLDIADGDDLLICKSGSDAGWIDISDFIRFANADMYFRLVTTVNASEAETFKIYFAG